jgi:hypothetical protein
MAYPSDILRWSDDDPGTTRDEPSEGEKDTGWISDDIPTHGIMNWLIGVPGDWIAWLKNAIDNGFEYVLKPSADNTQAIGGASNRWEYVYGKNVVGTNYRLDADRTTCMIVPLSSGLTNEFSGVKWTRSSGSGPNSDILISAAAGAQVAFLVQVPYGAKVTEVVVDWQPQNAGSGTKMCLKAHNLLSLLGNDGVDVTTEYNTDMLAAAKIEAAASTNRKWARLVTDQNNAPFVNDVSAVSYVRIEIGASSEAGGDKVYGLYLICQHRSVGHLGLAPSMTPDT